jgi:hypothetical protein
MLNTVLSVSSAKNESELYHALRAETASNKIPLNRHRYQEDLSSIKLKQSPDGSFLLFYKAAQNGKSLVLTLKNDQVLVNNLKVYQSLFPEKDLLEVLKDFSETLKSGLKKPIAKTTLSELSSETLKFPVATFSSIKAAYKTFDDLLGSEKIVKARIKDQDSESEIKIEKKYHSIAVTQSLLASNSRQPSLELNTKQIAFDGEIGSNPEQIKILLQIAKVLADSFEKAELLISANYSRSVKAA